ncbi:fasciclin domain-containing protein [Marinirhabdus gelatinilytica]|uniref:Putative surface protein with fasciclin (FAS1) repeats n=1 Tax=Marinirhabdus gelatinilytica TaxID=1703343 RepID=A0A370QAN8_9FLAO|nr:fasciclin domain-containing protein [Marinirhabdus gelatinilytica]RDK85433.1 putative surface protein with fasciclin (FAS1) repeats [Marinirhabdus gelatinilytica]
MKLKSLLVVALLGVFTATAQKYTNTQMQNTTKEWKGLTFSSEKSIFQNIGNTDAFSKAAPLLKEGVIAEDAMLTAFVMVNSSFDKFSKDEEEEFFTNLQKSFITYYFIPGRVDGNALQKAVANGNGVAYFDTVLGQRLGVKEVKGNLVLFDAKGNTAKIIGQDYYHKNGFFHIIDGLLLPGTK